MKRILSIICCLLAASLGAGAQDNVSMFTVDAGFASVHDSYLTPITYDGWDLALGYEAMRPTHNDWLWQLQVGGDYNNVENPARNNTLHKVMGNITFDMQRQWRGVFSPRLNLAVGPMTQLRAGILYDAVNSNNPVSLRAHWNAGVTGMATFGTHVKRLPLTLRWQAQLPVAGVFFAPEYDESYYEIYLGNRRNLAHLGWWGNRFDLTNYVGADLHLGKTTLRFGYRARLEHWSVNHLKVHDVTHSLVLGLSI
ncbi:MAG: DUF3316 domain-containing protein [Muribaculaceae bacterium]|nr:DUF3316 domain-containing protein [Muribaculaceae bacterium]